MRPGLETFSYHLAFGFGKMDVFGFIRRTAELGLTGVEINVEGDDLCHLGSDDPAFLRDVRAMTDELGLYVELDTCNTNPKSLLRVIKICHALGADRMRVYSSVGGALQDELKQAVKDFRQVLPACADHGVKIAYENHEFESSQDVLQVVRQVDSHYVGTHIDTGNSMMVWEDPIAAIRNMAPFGVSSHFKDHLVVTVNNQPMIVGVTLGRGSIDLAEAYRILAKKSPLERINIEVCYGYIAPFRVPPDKGYGAKLGEGAFRVQPPPYEPSLVAPYIMRATEPGVELNSYAWQDLSKMARSDAEREELLRLQDESVVESVAYVKKLKREVEGDGEGDAA
jgi:sugar phosphate isomerase/epimerase